MDKLKWIDSTGGPLILISDKSIGLWSGILKRSAYLANIHEDTEDFLNPDVTDYGKACLIEDYLGIVKFESEDVLILTDEPMHTTFFFSSEKPVLARWSYGENKTFVENNLLNIDLSSIRNWEFTVNLNLLSDTQFVFDSAYSENMLNKIQKDYLEINIKSGQYKISTSIYEPNNKTKLVLHKFEINSASS